jgi:hypothetical protein
VHFIEELFGLAPDGGTGSLELLWFLAPVAALLAIALLRRRTRRRSPMSKHATHRGRD